jgi:hypothetical protein
MQEIRPSASARRNGDGTATVHAIWNRDAEVERWIVRGGAAQGAALLTVGSAEWSGLDTTITLRNDVEVVEVVAEDALGRLIARSPVTPVSP